MIKHIQIYRHFFGEFYTIGKLYIDNKYICDTIEDRVRILNCKEDKIYGKTAILSGLYPADKYFSKKFGYNVIRLFNVKYFEGIYIHKGNTQLDSLGCIIVGYNDRKGWVSKPSVAMDKIMAEIGNFKFDVEIINQGTLFGV